MNKNSGMYMRVMKNMSDIKYKNFTKLMDYTEVEETKIGSCHDQVMYELHYIPGAKAIFCMEFKEGSNKCGRTHSFVYYKTSGKVFWFEHAWSSQKGIHGPYDSLNDLKKTVKERMLKESGYDRVEFAPFRGTPGMTLQELVDACMGSTVTEACKDLATARKLALEVRDLAKKYNANFYFVTDGASSTNNDGTNDAVKHARDTMKKWENKHGFDAKEDWSKEVTESTHTTGFFNHIYHISSENLDGKVLHPRIPHNRLTEHDLEENKTARVCFCPSIDKCLMAMSDNLKDKEFYVHIPKEKTKYDDVSKHQVADSRVTKEKWVKCDVELVCIGKIKVHEAKPRKYGYDFRDVNNEKVKKNEMNPKAYLYKWKWEWIEKYKK